MIRNQRSSVIKQNLLGNSTKLGERTLQAGKPALLALVSERSYMQPPRKPKRRDKQEHLDLAAGDLDQALTKVDLKLLARRGLKPHRRSRLRRQLSPIRRNRTLDGAKTDDNTLLGKQLLANDVGVPAMAFKSLPQPRFLPVEQLTACRLLVSYSTARLDVTLDRVATDSECSCNPARTKAQLETGTLSPGH
jgi:hypothetical protein